MNKQVLIIEAIPDEGGYRGDRAALALSSYKETAQKNYPAGGSGDGWRWFLRENDEAPEQPVHFARFKGERYCGAQEGPWDSDGDEVTCPGCFSTLLSAAAPILLGKEIAGQGAAATEERVDVRALFEAYEKKRQDNDNQFAAYQQQKDAWTASADEMNEARDTFLAALERVAQR